MSGERGRFITFEGVDSAGKGTQVARLSEWLSLKGVAHVSTFEPGGTGLGLSLRELLLAPNCDLDDPVAEAMLFIAARRHHLESVIRPALGDGKWVVCDRYADSTYAYQGGGGGADVGLLRSISRETRADLEPDLTVLLDVDLETSAERRRARNAENLPSARGGEKSSAPDQRLLWEDNYEGRRSSFIEAVRGHYLEIARGEPARVHVIDATLPEEEIHRQICRRIETRFGVG